jgi:hypothetical protein
MKTVTGTVVTTLTYEVEVEVPVDATIEAVELAMMEEAESRGYCGVDTEVIFTAPETSYSQRELDVIEDDDNEDNFPGDNRGYGRRVRQLEEIGMTTSDAQGVADMEWDISGAYAFA